MSGTRSADREELPLSSKHSQQCVPFTPLWSVHSYRLLVALLLMFSFFCAISMRIDLGMGVVCMVNSTAFLNNDSAVLMRSKSEHSACRVANVAELLVEEGYKVSIRTVVKCESLLYSFQGLISEIFCDQWCLICKWGHLVRYCNSWNFVTPIQWHINSVPIAKTIWP